MPDQRVVLFDSEGDVLMGMGALPTIAEKAPANLYHFMLDNGVYATTGGQPVPNAEQMEYEVVAQGCGYPATYAIDNLEDFASQIEEILGQPGPVFVALKIDPEIINEPINARPSGSARRATRPWPTCRPSWEYSPRLDPVSPIRRNRTSLLRQTSPRLC